MKRYLLVMILLILNVAVIGIAAPYLISEASTEVVLLGFVVLAALAPTDYWLIKRTIKG
jgi:hypothetical protein